MQEVRARKIDIIEGALLEIYQEYVPLRQSLGEARVKRVCDIGCGQGINNVFLNIEYAPQFTLVDIEETDDQYHFWADVGSGYASLNSAKDLLVSNGAKEADVSLINPTQQDFDQTGHEFDLVTSLYSCGFHYPIDEYTELFLDTIAGGGMVILDIRKKYMKFKSPGLSHLLAQAKMGIVYEDAKSIRVKFYSSCAGDE